MSRILKHQILQVSQMINNNVTEERIQDHNKDVQFRDMSRSIASGHIQSFINSKTYLDAEFPNFDYKKEYKMKDPEGNSMLHNACLNQRFVIVKYLLQNGFAEDINSRNNTGHTPLHNLIINICINQRFNKQLFDLLIEHGADILLKDKLNRSVMDFIQIMGVTFSGTDEIIKVYSVQKTRESRLHFLYCNSQATQNNEYLNKLNFHEKCRILKYM